MKTALIVEDLPETRDWLIRLVQTAFPGVAVRCADGVTAALASLMPAPELALVDLGLPDGSGLAVVDALARLDPRPVIVVATIFDDDGHLFPALQAGAQGYLLKDQPLEVLVGQLRGIPAGTPPISPAIVRRLMSFFQEPAPAGGEPLTRRERETLALLARGMKVAEVAGQLGISPNTAADYVKSVYRKLNISSRAQAAIQAARLGLVD